MLSDAELRNLRQLLSENDSAALLKRVIEMAAYTITDRQEWLAQMEEAGNDMAACWNGFYQACRELSDVGSRSREFKAKEKKATAALELVARMEGSLTDVMKSEFMNQYKILGAPGDFGYGTNEGRAMQAVYGWWNKLVQAK